MTQVLNRPEAVSVSEENGITLTRYEEARWNEITQHLGAMSTFVETPIWDSMLAKYPSLDLYSRPVIPLADRRDYVRDPTDISFNGDEENYGSIVGTDLIERVLESLRRW